MSRRDELDFNELKFLFRQLLEQDAEAYLEDNEGDTSYLDALENFAVNIITQDPDNQIPAPPVLSANFLMTIACFTNPKTPRSQSREQLPAAYEMNLRIIYAHEVLAFINSKRPSANVAMPQTNPQTSGTIPAVQTNPAVADLTAELRVAQLTTSATRAFTSHNATPYYTTQNTRAGREDITQKYLRWWNNLPQDQKVKLREQTNKRTDIVAILREILPRELIPQHSQSSATQNYDIALCYHYYFDYLYGASRDQRISLDQLLSSNTSTAPIYQNGRTANDLRSQLFYLSCQNTLLELENNLLWFNWLSHSHHHVSNSSNNDDAGGIMLFLLGVIAAIYTFKEVVISIKNLLTPQKILRSLYRLAMITVGIELAMLVGPSVIFIASSFELFLTAMIGAGLGAVFGRYSSRFFSSVFNDDQINPSSPYKYQLSDSQKTYLTGIGVNLAELNKLLKAIRDVKYDTFEFYSSWPWTQSYCDKKKFNMIIQELKDGKILGKISFKGTEYDLFADVATQRHVASMTQASVPDNDAPSRHYGFGYQAADARSARGIGDDYTTTSGHYSVNFNL